MASKEVLAVRFRTFEGDRSWMERAACVGHPPHIFYVERGHDASKARAVCASCPVRLACLRHAIETGDRFGVWGGATTKERDAIRQRLTASGIDLPESLSGNEGDELSDDLGHVHLPAHRPTCVGAKTAIA